MSWNQSRAASQYLTHPSLNVPKSFKKFLEFERKLEAVGISALNIRAVPANASWSKVTPIVHHTVSPLGRKIVLNVFSEWIRSTTRKPAASRTKNNAGYVKGKRGGFSRKSKSGKKVYKGKK